MGIFDKFKKKSNQKPDKEGFVIPSEEAVKAAQADNVTEWAESETTKNESENKPHSGMLMGVMAIIQESNNGELIVSGRVKGTIKAGDSMYITNCGEDNEPTVWARVSSIATGNIGSVSEVTDGMAVVGIEYGTSFNIKEGTVLYNGQPSKADIRNTYVNALGDVFVGLKQLEITDRQIERLSLADLAEIWHLFIWHLKQKKAEEFSEEQLKTFAERNDRIAKEISKKLLAAKEVYCIYSKATGEPYMFSQTVKQEQGYMCTPPHILIFTKSMSDIIIPTLSEDKYGVMPISNGEDGKGIYNFLGSVFYLNGANEVAIQAHQTSIPAQFIIPKPDYSNVDPKNIPVTNPDVVRWILLSGQIGAPKTKDEELVSRLYYGFMGRAMRNAKFLIPMQHDGEIVKGDEEGKGVLKKDTQIKIATGKGIGSRPAVRMFTDWRQLRMAYGEEWSGMVESIDKVIDKFDCAINAAKHVNAGFYVSKKIFEEMKRL